MTRHNPSAQFKVYTIRNSNADPETLVRVASCKSYSDLLFARPSFFRGVASVFDVFGARTLYNYSDSEDEADSRAIAADWLTVGCDLWRTIETHEEQAASSENDVASVDDRAFVG